MDIMQVEIEKKKEYLNRYLAYQKAAKRIEEDIEELQTGKIFPKSIVTGMPGSHNKKDLSDYMVQLDTLISRLVKARYTKIEFYSKIYMQIENMQDEMEKQVLVMKYIRGYKWERIAEDLNYSCRQIHNIHSSALQDFDMSYEI